MEFTFKVTPDVSHLFADATAAFLRSRADYVEPVNFTLLWLLFRDAEGDTVTVPEQVAGHMWRVWTDRQVWRDKAARELVRDQLRPQWKHQMIQSIPAHLRVAV
ncbi:hypothetical protein [Streptomyces sp. NPDC001422]|uniref:hypothetical protein n=1 Tax=Streptomyces sp. NPDC001422 TaxID=3364575 RepID=UPI00369B434A